MFFKKSILAVAAASMLFTFGACNKAELATDSTSAVALTAKWNKADVNSLIAFIPADSIAYGLNTHNFDLNSKEYKALLKWGMPMYENMMKFMEEELSDIDVSDSEKAMVDASKKAINECIALFKDYKGHAAEWGLDPDGHSDGIFYVTKDRIVSMGTVRDGEKFKAKMSSLFGFIGDKEDEIVSELGVKKSTIGEGDNAWTVFATEKDLDSSLKIKPAFVINVNKDMIVAAVLNSANLDAAKLAELKKPAAKSLTQKDLGKIDSKSMMVGKIDNVKLLEFFDDPTIAEFLNKERIVSAECMKDTKALVNALPSYTFSYNFDSETVMTLTSVLHMSSADEIKKINALHTSSIDVLSDKSLAGIKFNMDFDKTLQYITDLTSRLNQAQITCHEYQELIDALKELPAQASNPMVAPYLKGISGFNAALDTFDKDAMKFEGVINVTGPKIGEIVPGLLSLAKGMSPDIKLDFTKNSVTSVDLSEFDVPMTVNATYTDQEVVIATASRGDVLSIAKSSKKNRNNFFEMYVSSDIFSLTGESNPMSDMIFKDLKFAYTIAVGSNKEGLTMDVSYDLK